jgi:hypothetical protein
MGMIYISSQYSLVRRPADKSLFTPLHPPQLHPIILFLQQPKAKLETRLTDFCDVACEDPQQEGGSPSALNDSALEVLLQGGT